MKTFEHGNASITLGTPMVVTEGVGHHWFPRVYKSPGGHVVVSHSEVADSAAVSMQGSGVHISADRGVTWHRRFDVAETTGTPIQLDASRFGGPSGRCYVFPDDQATTIRSQFTYLEDDGARYVHEPWGVTVTGLPRPAEVKIVHGQHSQHRQAKMLIHGDILPVDGGLLGTAYLVFEGDTQYSNLAIFSGDNGRNWEYRSLIAGPENVSDIKEGPCEATTIRLESGELMCVMRVGSGSGWYLCRAYSSDEGISWTTPDRLPASSVDPTLCRTANGCILLTTGRPGIQLWTSIDPRGESWEMIDVIAHHNAEFDDPSHHIIPANTVDRETRHATDQTTAYTGMIEISPNEVLLAYDRTPFGWNPVPADSDERSRIYLLPIHVER